MSEFQNDKIRSDLDDDPDIEITNIQQNCPGKIINIKASCSLTNLKRIVEPDYEIVSENTNGDSGPYAAKLRPLL